jgi:phosphoglucosamine mutase
MIDKSGELVDGDELCFIIAKAWHEQSRLTNATVVGTKMSNLGMRLGLDALGITFIEADVGDRFVMQQMQKQGAILGAEGSGHIICLEQASSGDGIIAALQVLEILVKSQKSLQTLKNQMQKYPQVLINVKTNEEVDLSQQVLLQKMQKSIEKSMGKQGRVLIRASGTQPLVRVMVEAPDKEVAQANAEKLADVLR